MTFYKTSPEELLGIVAVTTFLVGFSTVRLQSSLQEWREVGRRVLERLLQQNAGEDLLPIPTTLEHLGSTSDSDFEIDSVTWLCMITSIATFSVSVGLTVDELTGGEDSSTYQLLLGLHFFILLIGVTDLVRIRRTTNSERDRSPSNRYKDLEQSISDWLSQPDEVNETSVLSACDSLDEIIPEWCWLSLIRSEVAQSQGRSFTRYKQSVSRIRRYSKSANTKQNDDQYSTIAYVWTSYLLDDNDASHYVTLADIESIAKFSCEISQDEATRSGADDVHGDMMSRLTLNCIARGTRHRRTPNSPLSTVLNPFFNHEPSVETRSCGA